MEINEKITRDFAKINEKKHIQLCKPPPVSRSRAITSENNGGFNNKGSNRMTFFFCFHLPGLRENSQCEPAQSNLLVFTVLTTVVKTSPDFACCYLL